MHIIIINGPNLNLLGKREPEVYGSDSFEFVLGELQSAYPDVKIDYFQSNIEGEIVEMIQKHGFEADGIILNAGGYTHTSVAIRDAIAAVTSSVVEVHISNIYAREEFRKNSIIAEVCIGSINGLGMDGYRLALDYYMHKLK